MCENPRQEPHGCRYVYGEVGKDWHYCQRTIKPGGRPGDPSHPPYCERHTRVTLLPSTEAQRRNYLKFIEKIADGSWRIDALGSGFNNIATPAELAAAESDNLVPVDVHLKLANRKGLSHG